MAENKSLVAGQQLPTPKKKKKKVSYISKKKKYTGKRYDTSALAAGQQVLTERKGRKDRGKKQYGSAEAGEIRRNVREEARKGRAKARPFGDAFKAARAAKKDKFLWHGKSYHTKTKSELEGAIGAKEKERFARAGKAKEAAPAKKGFFAKLKSLGSPVKGREERVKAKRIASMEKRKEEGKSYSKKNLAELKGSKTIPKAKDFAGFITKKKKKSYSISS